MKRKGITDGLTISEILHQEAFRIKQNTSAAVYKNGILVAPNLPSLYRDEHPSLHRPTSINLFVLGLCLHGSGYFQCDMQQCELYDYSLFIFKPGSILNNGNQHIEYTSLFLCDQDAMQEFNISIHQILPYFSELEKLTVVRLTREEYELMNSMFVNLAQLINSDESLTYYHQAVRFQIKALAYQYINLLTKGLSFHQKSADGSTSTPAKRFSTRNEEYFRKFINLLGIHFRQHRRASFYADALNITPKYLGMVISEYSGRSVPQWVDLYVMSEAKSLLLTSTLSIQEIAYELNFPNQSFFGKYFRAHTGMSPSKYRQCGGKM